MVLYRRNRVAGGTYFFTVTLRDRSSDVLVRHVGLLHDAFRSVRVEHRYPEPIPLTFWAYPCLLVACNENAEYHAFHVTVSVRGIYENKYIGAGAKASCGIAEIRLAPGADLGSRYPAAGFRRGMSTPVVAIARRRP